MFDDRQLQQAVLDELSWDPTVTAAHIGVAAAAGVVTLTGHVASFAEKNAAEMAARRIKGVRAFAEEIEVQLPFERTRDDADIAAAAIERLAWDATLPRDAVGVRVEAGWVTLTGTVERYGEKLAAMEIVRRLAGVVGVSNQIAVKTHVSTTNISADIMNVLHCIWFSDPKTITVSADGGTIRLTGIVHFPHEREIAAATAWSAPRTTAVENDMVVM